MYPDAAIFMFNNLVFIDVFVHKWATSLHKAIAMLSPELPAGGTVEMSMKDNFGMQKPTTTAVYCLFNIYIQLWIIKKSYRK
jgi:hypothetical protein